MLRIVYISKRLEESITPKERLELRIERYNFSKIYEDSYKKLLKIK